MKKLDKATLAERDTLTADLQSKFSDLEEAVTGFNNIMGEAWSAVQSAIEDYNAKLSDEWGNGLGPVVEQYNEAIANANQWKQDVAQSIQDYMDEKSEKWQESDAASNYTNWKEQFEDEFPTYDQEEPDGLELDQPEELPFDVDDAGALLDELPTELDQ